MTVHPLATSFGQVADDYDRWRPSYPADAVAWLAPPAALVADVGAGTGKLTELLIARGLEVDAVEPDPRMLAVLSRNNPTARAHNTDASHLPLDDASLDAVVVADAWHWFDPEPTVAEIRRVLKPGGWLGLVWNVVAEPVEPWEHALASDSDEYDRLSKSINAGLGQRLSYFPEHELTFKQVPWEWEQTPDDRAGFQATTVDGDRDEPGRTGERPRALSRRARRGLPGLRSEDDAGPPHRQLHPLDTEVAVTPPRGRY